MTASRMTASRMTASSLTARQRREVDAIKANMVSLYGEPQGSKFWLGVYEGYTTAMKRMYPDAITFMGEEPKATRMVLSAIAVEELSQ